MMKLLITIFIFRSALTISQTTPYYHYTPKDGLPSSNVMDMIQDNEGYIWFATANGISMFDGHNFINYGVSDGLNSSMITSLVRGDEGEIYIGNYEKGLNVFKDGKITNFAVSSKKELQINYLLHSQNKIYAYSNYGAYSVVERGGQSVIDTNMILFNGKIYNNLNKLKRLSNDKVIALTNNGIYKFENEKFVKHQIKGFTDEVLYCLAEDNHNILYAGGKGKIYIIKDFSLIDEINVNLYGDDDVFRILIDRQGNLWFSIINHGFYKIYAGSRTIVNLGKKLNLQNTQVNKFFEDNEGNIWVNTFDKGVYCFNNAYLTNYDEKDGLSNNNVQAITSDDRGRIFIGTFNGLNILYDESFKIINSNFKYNFTDYINEIRLINKRFFVCGSFGNKNLYTAIRNNENTEYLFFTAPSFCKTRDNFYLIGDWGNDIFKQKEFEKEPFIFADTIFIIGDEAKYNRINKIFEDSKGILWIGTSLGLCMITGGEKKLFPDNEVLSNKIESIIEDRNNNLWFAGDKGIAVYDSENGSIKNYTTLMEHDLSSSSSLSADNKNRIWAGSKNGIYIIDKASVKHLEITLGLPSNEVQCLYYDSLKNNMWIGTSGGLSRLDLNLFDNYSLPPLAIKINRFSVNDSSYSFEYLPSLGFEQNNIRVEFTAVSFSSPGSITYSYKLNEHAWQDIKTNSIAFPELAPGNFLLSIKAKRLNGQWSEPLILHFEITPPFYRKLWVETAGVILFSFFVILSARKRIKHNKKKYKEKLEMSNRMNELKHQALAAMMNPHFIFNSLSSVQYLVNLNKQKEANDYISLMARLVRLNLDTAVKAFITIEEELKRLNLYMAIEKLRLDGKFVYEIIVDKEIPIASLTIPNMIIQPFVENSIWHGIAPLKETGIIKITIDYEDVFIKEEKYKFLIIRVKDNGVGYSNLCSNKKEGHTSMAIKLIRERLTILSQKMELPVPVVIDDLGKRAGNSSGTEITLSLPPGLYGQQIS